MYQQNPKKKNLLKTSKIESLLVPGGRSDGEGNDNVSKRKRWNKSWRLGEKKGSPLR